VFSNPLIGEATTGSTSWLLSAGAHIGFGVSLFYTIKKFFKEVEDSLNQDTKIEIATWVLDLKPTVAFRLWYSTSLSIFDKVFGGRHLSWKCFSRSLLFTVALTLIGLLALSLLWQDEHHKPLMNVSLGGFAHMLATLVLASFLPDYLSLWKTRLLLNLGQAKDSLFLNLAFSTIDVLLTFLFTWCTLILWEPVAEPLLSGDFATIHDHFMERLQGYSHPIYIAFYLPLSALGPIIFIPAFFGRIWLLAYVISGVLLKISKNIDFGFAWFNRRFDVKNHPLQSIVHLLP
jgi:hypothetical protein